MGQNKALVVVDGAPLVRVVADKLRATGVERVVVAGSVDIDELAQASGCEVVPDRLHDRGPLGGIDALLGLADVVITCPCDVPAIETSDLLMLEAALRESDDLDVAYAAAGGEAHPLVAAWRTSRASAIVADEISDGGAAVKAALDRLETISVEIDAARLLNLNTPADLAAFSRP